MNSFIDKPGWNCTGPAPMAHLVGHRRKSFDFGLRIGANQEAR